ncbi:hypothetical protein GCM10028862_02920 [Luteimonas pelagia]
MKLALLLLVLAASGCTRSPAPPGAAESDSRFHAGYYTEGFETREFRSLAALEERWWVEGSLPCAFLTLDQERHAPWHHVYVELEGTVSPAGQFGHLGAYDREIAVTRVVSCRPLREGETVEP